MAVRKGHVARLVRATRSHDAALKDEGYRATRLTDKLRREYDRARSQATEEERKLFDRIYR